MNILVNNFRFIKKHYYLTILKVFLVSAGFSFSSYYISSFFFSDFLPVRELLIGVSIAAVNITIYQFFQDCTTKFRRREIFIRKWYGGKARDIFIIVFSDHLVVTAFGVLISLLSVDILHQFIFLKSFVTNISGNSVYYISVIINAAILLITGGLNLKKLSKAKISELFIRIS